jgi:hypothetical protein
MPATPSNLPDGRRRVSCALSYSFVGAGRQYERVRLGPYRRGRNGRSGVYEFRQQDDVVPDGERPRVRFDDYDWTRNPGKFREEEA